MKDDAGRTVEFTDPPRRVISFVPSITESLFDLGLGERVVGVTRFCTRPADKVAALPRVGGQKDPDFNSVERLEPDLVIVNREENKPEHILEFSRRYRTWVTYPRSLADAAALLDQLGRVFEVEERTAAYSQSIASAAARRRCTHGDSQWRTVYLIWRNPWMTINADTFIHDILHVHGMENLFGSWPDRYPVVTMDDMAAASPDLILLPDEPYRFRQEHLKEFAGLQEDRRVDVLLVDGSYFCWYGTRTARASRYILDHVLTKTCR